MTNEDKQKEILDIFKKVFRKLFTLSRDDDFPYILLKVDVEHLITITKEQKDVLQKWLDSEVEE